MHLDVEELRTFYATPLGGVVRRLLTHRIRARWRSTAGETVIGLGFATPFLGPFRGEAKRLGALMPGPQGALVWPRTGPVHTVLTAEDALPLPDQSVDRLLIVHGLEASDHVRRLLRDSWRVLAPEGRMLLVVPNRRGLWARTERTPFGHGRPYSTGQLRRLLDEAMYSVLEQTAALYMPPFERALLLRPATAWERIGARAWPGFAGVHLVEARKEIASIVGGTAKARQLGRVVTGHARAIQAGGKDGTPELARSQPRQRGLTTMSSRCTSSARPL
jgi:SAM-dependent methyltransferase